MRSKRPQSKHLKGPLGPRVRNVTLFGSKMQTRSCRNTEMQLQKSINQSIILNCTHIWPTISNPPIRKVYLLKLMPQLSSLKSNFIWYWYARCHTLMTNFDRCRPPISKQKTGNPDDKDKSGGVEDLSRPHQFSKSPLTNHHRLLHHCNRNITN